MSSLKFLALLFVAGLAQAASGDYLLGGGVETDTADGVRGVMIAGLGLGEETWLSTSASLGSVELGNGDESNTAYADIELDHHFGPVGIRIGAAYWGDPDNLDSVDLRGALYWQNASATIAGEYEYRDFNIVVPAFDTFPGREFSFDADGLGLRINFRLGENVSLGLSGMKYDYSVDFQPDENRDAARLLSVSRLSPINDLIDNRASINIGLNQGLKRWGLNYSTWKSAIDQSRTRSVTINYLMPLSDRSDIEFGLGYDASDLYGNVTFFSIFLYFYGSR
jgi:hypothetical protein